MKQQCDRKMVTTIDAKEEDYRRTCDAEASTPLANVYTAKTKRSHLSSSPESHILTRRLTKSVLLQNQTQHCLSAKAKNLNYKQQRRAATLQYMNTKHTLRY